MKNRYTWSALVSVVIAVGLYAWQIEPYWIDVTHHSVHLGLKKPVRMMLLSDLHTRQFGRLEKKVLETVDHFRPDVIVITGDCFSSRSDHQASHALLSKLKAPLGIWVSRGNWENWNPVSDEAKFFKSAGVQLLLNSHALVREDLALVGLDDPWTGTPDLALAEANLPKNIARIALFHAPVYVDAVAGAGRYPLCLAGHTHGGQVRLPFLGAVWLPGGCGRYVQGWYKKGGSKLYVTRGVGTSIAPIRFLCRPEIPIFTLE